METIIRKKSKFIKDITMIGTKVTEEPFSLSKVIDERDGKCYVKIADSTGSLTASIPEVLARQVDIKSISEGSVLKLTGVYMNDGMMRVLVVSAATLCNDFVPAELFAGITNEEILSCKKGIREIISGITNPGYRALCESCLTDEVLDRMAELPATLNLYGKYNGGCLVATNAVSHMVLSSMASYTKRGNSFSTIRPKWNVMMSASLLFLYGNIEFFTEQAPYKRTKIGVSIGYMALLQQMLETKVHQEHILLTAEEMAELLNILRVSVETNTSIRATSKEGSVLRHILALYIDSESFDWDVTTHEGGCEEEGYYYSKNLKSYIIPNTEG